MICFICNNSESIDFFYCKQCKKTEICLNCWQNWLNLTFTCPFDKTNIFLLEITDKNKKILFENEDDIFEFQPLYNNNFIIPKHLNKGFQYSLDIVILYYSPFFHEEFHSIELDYCYFHIKSFYHMGVLQIIYDKWVLALILSHIMYDNFIINVKDIKYFGNWAFINFINKYFDNKIIIQTKIQTQIIFNPMLWSPKTKDGFTFENDLKQFLYNHFSLNKVDFDQKIITNSLSLYLPKHEKLTEIFLLYYKHKLQNTEPNEIDVNDVKNYPYFNIFFIKYNNGYALI